jgi:hypothetical protein
MLLFSLALSIVPRFTSLHLVPPVLVALLALGVTISPIYADVPDKFIPTFTLKLGSPTSGFKSPKETAKFDMLLAGTGLNQAWSENGKNSWQTLKGYNPDMQILLYRHGPSVYNTASWGDLGLGWQWMKNNHGASATDRWTGSGLTYNYLANSSYPNERLMHLGNTNWQKYWYQTIYNDLWQGGKSQDHTGANGIFSDLTGYEVSYADRWYAENNVGNAAFKDHPVDYYNAGAYNHTKWKRDMNTFFNAAVPWLKSRPENILLLPNFNLMHTHPEYWQELDGLTHPPFAAMQEGGIMSRWGSDTYNIHHWTRKIATMKNMRNVRVLFNNHGDPADLSSANGLARMALRGTDGLTGWEALWFSMCSFLMALNGEKTNGYMNFTVWGYTEYYWFDEFDPQYLHLGAPVGDYYQAGSVYFREYEDGWVVVNPSTTDATNIAVPRGEARVLHHGNFKNPENASLVSSFNLKSHHGIVLLSPGRMAGNADNVGGTTVAFQPPTNLRIVE